MAKVKRHFWKIVAMITSMLTSCLEIDDNGYAEYGMPYAELNLSGTVQDKDTEPIKGIEISHENSGLKSYSDSEGTFSIQESYWIENSSIVLTFKDIDGKENGGEFKETSYQVELEKTENGSGSWDRGTYEKHGITVALETKIDGGDDPVEYDPQSTVYQVAGTVTDTKGSPIEDIEVRLHDDEDSSKIYGSSLSAKDGSFSITYTSYDDDTAALSFKDPDGQDNGGEFESSTVTIVLSSQKETNVQLNEIDTAMPEYGIPSTKFKK